MNKLCIYICSYNGCNDTIRCLHSLMRQTFLDFDICVIDNASTDGTFEALVKEFSNTIKIIRNEENLGGSGGFEKGIQDGFNRGYKYIGLMDNDIFVDKNAVRELIDTIENDENLGAVGAKILYMDKPEIIYDFGSMIDFKHRVLENIYRNRYDNEKSNIILESDFVPATAAIFRREALLESGTMPVDNFIYYDDIELGYKLKLHGWKIVYNGKAKVWHKSSCTQRHRNNFSDYYFTRNSLNFWAKYLDDKDIELFVENQFERIFIQLYGSSYKRQINRFLRIWYPFYDFISSIRGKAEASRILPIKNDSNYQLQKICQRVHMVRVNVDANAEKGDRFIGLIEKIRLFGGDVRVIIYAENNLDMDYLPLNQNVEWNFSEPEKPLPVCKNILKSVDTEIHYVGHVLNVVNCCILPAIYVDSYYNVLDDYDAYEYFSNFNITKKRFFEKYKPLALDTIKKIRDKNVYALKS